MKIVTVFFDHNGDYKKLLNVMLKSAEKYMAGFDLKIIGSAPPKNSDMFKDTFFGFMPAIDYAINSNEELAIVDVDLMFTGDISDAFNHDFDIAVTVRDQPKYNTGVWFYRPTEKARNFLKQWKINTQKVFDNFNIKVVQEHGGIDQASLAKTIEENKDAKVIELPCQIYNAEQRSWPKIDHNTKVIHIKSGLRGVCLGTRKLLKKHYWLKPIVDKWRAYNDSTN